METVFCPYCGCGCTLRLKCSGGAPRRAERTLPDADDVVSKGRPCMKGLTIHEMLTTNRLQTPMMRSRKRDELEPCSWEDAFALIKSKLVELEEENGRAIRDKVYFLGSGEFTNESNYVLSKLARSHFGTNNIDSCARLCHSATATALKRMFGIAAIPTYTMDDLVDGDTFLFIGTDPMEDYPVLFNRVLEAKRRGAKVITIDLASSSTTEQSDHVFQIAPHGILPLLSHLIVMLVDGGDVTKDAHQMKGYNKFVESARSIAQTNPPSSFGFTREDMEQLYWLVNDAKRLVLGYGMGLTQHENGTQNVYAVASLGLLTNAMLFPNRGKVNIQGAGDVGVGPSWRPRVGSKWQDSWNSEFMSHQGSAQTEKLYDNGIEFVWVVGTNPSQSMPDLNALDRSLTNKFVVLQHHHPVRTMEFADVVLPSTMLTEELGCFTNGERRVRGMFEGDCKIGGRTTLNEGLGDIKSNASIIVHFAQYIGAEGFNFESLRDIFEEMVDVVPGYEKLSLGGVGSVEGQLADKEPKYRRFISFTYNRRHFEGAGEYPFVFTTARNRFQFCTSGASQCSRTLRDLAGLPAIYINPQDAQALGIGDESNIRLRSSVGEIVGLAKWNASVGKRVLVGPFHFEKLLVNRLTPRTLDPESKTPSYKEVPVKVELA